MFETSNMGTQRRNCFLWHPIWFGMSHKTIVLWDGSLLKHWTRAQNWCSIWFGTSYWTSVLWYVYLLRRGKRAHDGGQKEKNDVWHHIETSYKMSILGYRSHLRHWTRAQSWCIMWFGMSCRTSVWEMDLFWDIRRGYKADVLYDLDNRDVLSDLGHRLRHQLWELDLFWDIKQEHKTDILYDLGCHHVGHPLWEMDIFWDLKQQHKTHVLYNLGCHIRHQFWEMDLVWDIAQEHKIDVLWFGLSYGSHLRHWTRAQNWRPVWLGWHIRHQFWGEGSCLRLRTRPQNVLHDLECCMGPIRFGKLILLRHWTRAQNWRPVWFVTSSGASVVGIWISSKTWDKSTKLTSCVIWDVI